MPIKIHGGSFDITKTPPDGSNVYRSELQNGIYSFTNTYFIGESDSGYTKSVVVDWDSFKNTVVAPIIAPGTNHIDVAALALRFFHRYNPSTKEWFVSVATCAMSNKSTDAKGRTTYDLTEKGQRYNVKNGSIKPTKFSSAYDKNYFDTILYYDETSFKALDLKMHVKSVTFPWQSEIQKLYDDNYSVPTTGVTLTIQSCSFYCDVQGGDDFSAVEWPHGIVFFLSENGIPKLDDGDYTSIYRNHGADFSTMCPPSSNCPILIYPPDVKMKKSNFR